MTASEKAKPPSAGEGRTSGDDIRTQAIRGAAWMMGLQWAVRGLGIASTAILARLLTPSDFGLMAMATLTLAVIAMFGVTGQDLALIRLGRPSRDYFNSAWTIEVIAGIVLFAAALAVSPLARLYFHSAEVELIVCMLALRLLLDGFTNIGIVYFRIDFDFVREFRYFTCRKLCAVGLGVVCVLFWRNVWGLVIAGVLAKAVDVILSYAMHRFRPRFSLQRAREIWSYSSWMLIVAHGRHLAARTDEYVVGALGNAAAMGAYNVGADISVTPTIDLVQPVMRALFPVYSRLLGDPERLRNAALRVIAATATVCLATGPGVAGIARELTLLLLGAQWSQASSLVFWFGIGAIPFGLRFAIHAILGVTDNLRLTAAAVWIRVVLLIPVLVVAGRWGGVAAIAEAQALLSLVTLGADIAVLRLAVRVGFGDFARCVVRPLAAAVAMAVVLALCGHGVHLPLAASLVVKITAGAATYLGSLLGLWLLAHRPDGLERVAATVVANAIGRCVQRWR